jgi:hypothetical protein
MQEQAAELSALVGTFQLERASQRLRAQPARGQLVLASQAG